MSRGNLTITVEIAHLLETLKENRDEHRAAFELAVEGYRILCGEELDQKKADLLAGKPIERYLKHQPPEDNTGEYNTVIHMLEWAEGDYIDLTQAEFTPWVENDWGWNKTWSLANESYVTAASL